MSTNAGFIFSAVSSHACLRAAMASSPSVSDAANIRALYHMALNSTRYPERGMTGRPFSAEFIHDTGDVSPIVESMPFASTRRLGCELPSIASTTVDTNPAYILAAASIPWLFAYCCTAHTPQSGMSGRSIPAMRREVSPVSK